MSFIEKQVINKAVTDVQFGKEVFAKLPISAFKEDMDKQLVQVIRRYYLTHNKPLGEQDLLAEVSDNLSKRNADPETQLEFTQHALDVYNLPEDYDEDFRNEKVYNFVRKQMSIEAIKNALSSGDNALEDDAVLDKLATNLKEIAIMDDKSKQDGMSLDFFNDTELKLELYKSMSRDTYPTGFQNLDEILDGGGLAKGEVGLVIAPTGYGKTSIATQLASNAILNKLNVLYVTLEERESRMAFRVETNILQKGTNDFFDNFGNFNEELYIQVQEYYKKLDIGELYIEKNNPHQMTITDLEQAIINWKIRKGAEIDVVIIDYPALMKTTFYKDDGSEIGTLFEEIRALAQKYNFVCWTLGQTNRGASLADVVTSANIEGSRKVLNTVELVLVMNRKKVEYDSGLFRLYIDKIRNPADGILVPEFLYFKTSNPGYNIIAETPTEARIHIELLANEGKEFNNNKKEANVNNFDKALGVVDKTNESLNFA